MANLLSSRPLKPARSARATGQEPCSTSQVAWTVMSYRAVRPSVFAAPLDRREQQAHASFVIRSIPVSGPGSANTTNASGGVTGQVTAELINSMREKICEALETETCTVTDVYGDGRHVSIDVVSKLFQDKNSMQRQRMVYKAIWLELQEAVHAVDSMSTKTPEEGGARPPVQHQSG